LCAILSRPESVLAIRLSSPVMQKLAKFMKLNIALLFMFFISLNTSGQVDFYVGIQGGGNITNIASDLSQRTQNLKGLSGGLNFQIVLPGRFFVGLDLLYVQNGYASDNTITDENENILYLLKIKDHYNYLGFPVKIGYEIGRRIKGFSNIGVQTSVLLSAKSNCVFNLLNGQEYYEEYNIVNSVDRVDFGGIVELGTEIVLGKSFELMALASYKRSFTNFSNSKFYNNHNFKHIALCLSLGLKYKLSP
jgi:hypothetical protein